MYFHVSLRLVFVTLQELQKEVVVLERWLRSDCGLTVNIYG